MLGTYWALLISSSGWADTAVGKPPGLSRYWPTTRRDAQDAKLNLLAAAARQHVRCLAATADRSLLGGCLAAGARLPSGSS